MTQSPHAAVASFCRGLAWRNVRTVFMAKKLNDWIETDVRPHRDKSIAWISQHHFFRDPMRPTYSDLGYFFSPADGIILYQREVRPDECIVEIKGRAYSPRDALRDPHYEAPSLVIGIRSEERRVGKERRTSSVVLWAVVDGGEADGTE